MADKTTEPTREMKVWQIVNLIPRGRVATYGKIAELADMPNHSRWVGSLMRKLPKNTTLPWHRVVKASGHIASRSGAQLQKKLLLQEGVLFQQDRINLKKYGWPSFG